MNKATYYHTVSDDILVIEVNNLTQIISDLAAIISQFKGNFNPVYQGRVSE